MNSKRAFLRAVFVLFTMVLSVRAASADSAGQPGDREQILKIEQEACAAYLHADAAYLDQLFTTDFVFTNGRGESNGKAAELAEVRKKEVHYTEFANHDQVIRLHGDTCVVTGRTFVKGMPPSGPDFTIEVSFTDVFTRIDGRWQMIAGHVSRIPAKPATAPQG